MSKDEALTKLARQYFSSRGPATLKDFVWWSGLSLRQAKLALDLASPDLLSETINSKVYWFTDLTFPRKNTHKQAFLLPDYDEFLIGYEDRRASIPFTDQKKTISSNGIFRPIIVLDGQVIGMWKRQTKNDRVKVETSVFMVLNKTTNNLIEKAVIQFGRFSGKKIQFIYK